MSHIQNDARYEVKDEDAQRRLRTLAALIDEHMTDGWGFGLLMFERHAGGGMFWISSARREDMIVAMREWIAKQERSIWAMDTRNLTMYPSLEAALAADVPESALSEMKPIADSTWAATSGPFKGRVYRRNHLGQMVRDRAAERRSKDS